MDTPQHFLGLITRCKNEEFVKEFVNYYLAEGVDKVYVLDDESDDKSIYNGLLDHPKVEVIFAEKIIQNRTASHVYQSIRSQFEWMVFVDVDEFISTRKNKVRTIREELKQNFQTADCVKVPWVMMASNNLERSPESVLHTNVWRWNHDRKHPNPIHKFRCRFDEIEVKCIFRTCAFDDISDHHPTAQTRQEVNVVEAVRNEPSPLTPFYPNLREESISEAYLVCYHYRIVSRENNDAKLRSNLWYKRHGYTMDDLASSDHNDLLDPTMSSKTNRNRVFIIGFNRCGTRTLHYFFQQNGLRCIHWDQDHLAQTMEDNCKAGLPLLQGGRTHHTLVNDDCFYEDAHVLSDLTLHKMNRDAKDYYQQLDIDYPGSKFILNVRDVDSWIDSRVRHNNGRISKILQKYHQCGEVELKQIWRDMWETATREIVEYFRDRPDDLLVYDIENDPIESVCTFLDGHFQLDVSKYEVIR